MPTFHSDYFSSDDATFTAIGRRVAALTHGWLGYRRAHSDNADTADDDIIRMMKVHSGDRPTSLLLSCTDTGSAGTMDVGLYLEASDDGTIGAVVVDDLFASAIDTNAAALSRAEALTEAGLDDFDRGKTVWEMLGLSADPGIMYEICITMDEGSTDAFDVALELEFLQQTAS